MCYRTVGGAVYNCSFFTINAALRGTDLRDPVDVACTIDFVEWALDGRGKEELVGTGDLTREHADRRLRGAVRELETTERQAAHHQAPPPFMSIIGDSLHEARRALAVAEAYKATKQPKQPEPKEWSTKRVPEEDDAPLYSPVTTDDLLDAVADIGAVSGRAS